MTEDPKIVLLRQVIWENHPSDIDYNRSLYGTADFLEPVDLDIDVTRRGYENNDYVERAIEGEETRHPSFEITRTRSLFREWIDDLEFKRYFKLGSVGRNGGH